MQIYSNSASNNPGLLLSTLVGPAGFAASGAADYTFPASAPFAFLPSTTYWLVLSSAAGGDAFSWTGDSVQRVPTDVAMHFGQRFGGVPPTGSSNFISSYAISVNPTPRTFGPRRPAARRGRARAAAQKGLMLS